MEIAKALQRVCITAEGGRVLDRTIFSRIFLTVLILDQLVKGLGLLLLHAGQSVALLPGFGFALIDAPTVVTGPERLRLVVVGLLAVLLLLRVFDRDNRAGDLAAPGMDMVAAGVITAVIDILLLRQKLGLFYVAYDGYGPWYFTVGEAAVVAGGLLLLADFVERRRIPLTPQVPLREAAEFNIELNRFPRGIDNLHIDVSLSPRFRERVHALVESVLGPRFWWESWRGAVPQPSKRALRDFRNAYLQLMESAIHRARHEQNVGLVTLTQLATLKYVLTLVASEFERLLQELRKTLDMRPIGVGRDRMRMQEQLGTIQRQRRQILEEASTLLLHHMHRVEVGPLRELRRSLLGADVGLPEGVLDNPVLSAEDAHADDFLLHHYLLMGHRADDAANFGNIDRLLMEFLGCGESDDAGGDDGLRMLPTMTRVPAGQAGVQGPALRAEPCPWLDEPENAEILFGVEQARLARRRAREQGERAQARRLNAHMRFQRRMLRRLERALRLNSMLRPILVAYEVPEVFRALEGTVSARVIQRYLSGPRGRTQALEKMRRLTRKGDRDLPLQVLEEAARRVRFCPVERRFAVLQRFVRDFLTYRRDLKRARIVRGWMAQLRLLEGPADLRLSRTNRTLHELMMPADEAGARQPDVQGHVILKADVRGSTRIIEQLVERGLNPASHFSIHFFEPIGNLTELYGAEKVFVEGDAIILALLDYDVEAAPRLAVARACGLARSILEVVAAHNQAVTKYGLPPLELGVGIAFDTGAPTYLFDEDRPVMISPAIARADRLSSCAAFLRKDQAIRPQGRVQVYRAAGRTAAFDKKGTELFRYNVDGIELEAPAFAQLNSEIHLQRVEARLSQDGSPQVFWWGSYPDQHGVVRSLVVRESRVQYYDRRQGSVSATEEPFYEVVADADVLKLLERTGAGEARTPRSPRAS